MEKIISIARYVGNAIWYILYYKILTWKWRQISQSYIMTQWIRIIIVFPRCGVRIISRIILVFPQGGIRIISKEICFYSIYIRVITTLPNTEPTVLSERHMTFNWWIIKIQISPVVDINYINVHNIRRYSTCSVSSFDDLKKRSRIIS